MALAFIFDSVGAGEWLLLLAVLLVVMGPKRLPGVLRKFGNHYAKFRRAADSFKRQLMEMDTEFERAARYSLFSELAIVLDKSYGEIERIFRAALAPVFEPAMNPRCADS